MARLNTLLTKEGKEIDEFEAGSVVFPLFFAPFLRELTLPLLPRSNLLTKYRSQEKHFRGLAYDNISGSGPNGALPHYSPVEGKCRLVDRETPYVNDSGAQYLGQSARLFSVEL